MTTGDFQDTWSGWETDPQHQLQMLAWIKSQLWPSCTLTDNWIIRSRIDRDYDKSYVGSLEQTGDFGDTSPKLKVSTYEKSVDPKMGLVCLGEGGFRLYPLLRLF